ncbi:MAG: multiheme c-type cytochrome [Terriglobia bacterium]
MKSVRLPLMTLACVAVGAAVLLADLKEWKKTRFEVIGREVPHIQSMDEFRLVFTDPLVCSGCHQSHFEAWSQSYHAKSVQNAGFQALYVKYLNFLKTGLGRESTVEDLRQCLFCHAPPVQFASDELVQQVSAAIVAGNWEEIRGMQISCVVCHSMTPEGKWSLESFALTGTKFGPVRDPVPPERAVHSSRYSELHTQSEFCAICHSRQTFNVFCSLVYDQYRETASASQGKVCQDCHMPATENVRVAVGGKDKRILHSHTFAGGRFQEMWPEAIDLKLRAEQKGGNEILVTVTMKSKVPHNIPDG